MANACVDGAQPIIVIGAGGHGREVMTYVHDLSRVDRSVIPFGFVDDHQAKGLRDGIEILGSLSDLEKVLQQHPETTFRYITAVGDNGVRARLVHRIEGLGLQNLAAWTIRHPGATVGPHITIEEGACVAPEVVLTTAVQIGAHSILNVRASVSHDSIVGRFTNLNPGVVVCGNVRIGEGSYIGAGATIINNVSIGEWTVVGAGAVVIGDLPSHVTAVGVPARVIKTHDSALRRPAAAVP